MNNNDQEEGIHLGQTCNTSTSHPDENFVDHNSRKNYPHYPHNYNTKEAKTTTLHTPVPSYHTQMHSQCYLATTVQCHPPSTHSATYLYTHCAIHLTTHTEPFSSLHIPQNHSPHYIYHRTIHLTTHTTNLTTHSANHHITYKPQPQYLSDRHYIISHTRLLDSLKLRAKKRSHLLPQA